MRERRQDFYSPFSLSAVPWFLQSLPRKWLPFYSSSLTSSVTLPRMKSNTGHRFKNAFGFGVQSSVRDNIMFSSSFLLSKVSVLLYSISIRHSHFHIFAFVLTSAPTYLPRPPATQRRSSLEAEGACWVLVAAALGLSPLTIKLCTSPRAAERRHPRVPASAWG